MKQTKLLLCSALFIAPLSGVWAKDAAPNFDSSAQAADEFRKEALSRLELSLDLDNAANRVLDSVKMEKISSNPIADARIFMPTNTMIAQFDKFENKPVGEENDEDAKDFSKTQKTITTVIQISNT
ncbi:hypothetical protein [Pelagicoccus albus]|uniref:Uncharacterized protein n=1 Tax=Pelagicoccus albus TaxID=415222 RepID=A0A7X1B2V6_9BACT|nr:hypothetical protein [Pelagicoccus albus]MBC2604636.1 hypothetical protein [Pelagicoccus albus]